MNFIADELRKNYEPVDPMDFYRDIFPDGELEEQEPDDDMLDDEDLDMDLDFDVVNDMDSDDILSDEF